MLWERRENGRIASSGVAQAMGDAMGVSRLRRRPGHGRCCGNEGKETEQQASGTLNMAPICAEQEHTRRRRGYAARPLQNQVGTLVCIGNGLGV